MSEKMLCGYSEELRENLSAKEIFDAKKNSTDAAVIRYEDFGAVGDGVNDDSEAIRKAHEAANDKGLPVVGRSGAVYYIGALDKTIIVKTNTDWNGAKFIFDDDTFPWTDHKLRGVNVFTVVSDSAEINIPVPKELTLSKAQSNIGIKFDEPCMLRIESSDEKIYCRYGENANGGVNKYEFILVDAEGNVDSSTPIQYDYSSVTKITAYSLSDTPISIGNGSIKTIAPNPKAYDPDYENNYCYYSRGISVRRSNTTLYGIKHTIEGEDMTIEIDRNGDGIIDKWGADKSYGVPYIGFFSFRDCNNVLMSDCFVQGHQAYSFYQGATRNEKGNIRNEMGSYDINATNCINLKFVNIVQYENQKTGEVITNRFMYHGVMGSNFCRNVLMDNCYLDRFDSHQGLHNAVIKNSTLGFGILVIGGGDLYIENVYRISGYSFIHLRMDYNSIFDGNVTIKNSRAGENISVIVHARWISFYNGLPNRITDNLVMDNFVADATELYMYDINCATPDSLTDETNRLYLPESVTLKDVCIAGNPNAKPMIAKQNEMFESVKLICK